MERSCLECGEKVIGRSDKVFCCDFCRNAYNNKKRRDQEKETRQTNNILFKNMRILLNLEKAGRKSVPVKTLLEQKFDFNHYTHSSKSFAHRRYYHCYSFKYYISLGGVVHFTNNSEKTLPLPAIR